MRNLLAALCLLTTSQVGATELNITLKVVEAASENFSIAVPSAFIKSGPYQLFTDFDGKATYYNISEDILFEPVEIAHPEFTFPKFQLQDFPYELEGDRMVFTIAGIACIDAPVLKFDIRAAKTKKNEATMVSMYCQSLVFNDSLILLNNNDEYLTSFSSFGMYTNHSAYNIPLSEVEMGGKIVSYTSGDTTKFSADQWMQVIPLHTFNRVTRATSEISSIITLHDRLQATERTHNKEVNSLKREIIYLEDSISEILNPDEFYPAPIEMPIFEEKEHYLFIAEENAEPLYSEHQFNSSLQHIVTNQYPLRKGTIAFRILIERDGQLRVKNLTSSEGHKAIEILVTNFLQEQSWKPYQMGGNAYESTQIIQINIIRE